MPVVVWVCITQCATSTWPWIALCVTKPARLTACSVGRTGWPSMSTATRFEAVTSWYIRPKGLIRNTRCGPGTRSVMWLKIISVQPSRSNTR